MGSYHVFSYQPRVLRGRNPDAEDATLGVVIRSLFDLEKGREGGQIFKEKNREVNLLPETEPGLEGRVLAHEVGHQFGLCPLTGFQMMVVCIVLVSCFLTSLAKADLPAPSEAKKAMVLSGEYVDTKQYAVKGTIKLEEKAIPEDHYIREVLPEDHPRKSKVVKETVPVKKLVRTDYSLQVGYIHEDAPMDVRTRALSTFELHAKGEQLSRTWSYATVTSGTKDHFHVLSDKKGKYYLAYTFSGRVEFIDIETMQDDKVLSLSKFVRTLPNVKKSTSASLFASIGLRSTRQQANWGMGPSSPTIAGVEYLVSREDEKYEVKIEDVDGVLHTFVGKGYEWSLLKQ